MIEKNDKKYDVLEYGTKWVLKSVDGKLTTRYEVSKKDCATREELNDFIQNSDL